MTFEWGIKALAGSKKKTVYGIIAILVVLAINSTEFLVAGEESGNIVLNFISKVAYTVSVANIVDILSYVGIYVLLCYVFHDDRKISITGIIISVLLAFLYMWCFSYKLTGFATGFFENKYQIILTLFRLFGHSCLFYLLFEMLSLKLEKLRLCDNGKGIDVFIISSIIVFAGWLFWIIMAYPGSVSSDGVTQLGQFYFGSVTAHHPPLSTWFMGLMFRLGTALTKDTRFGVFLYLLVQTLIGAMIIGHSIRTMYRLGIKKTLCICTAVFFGITPIFGLFAQWYEKDLMYGLFTLLFLDKVTELVFKKDDITVRDGVLLTIFALLCVFLRNNGIHAVIPTVIALAILLKKKNSRTTMIISAVVIMVASFMVNNVIFTAMGIEKGNIKEMLSAPMQMSARYIRDHGDHVTEEEREVLELFFNDYDNVAANYDPTCADPVKNMVFVEKNNLPTYFKTWFKMGLKQPGTYFDAFICLNYGYLAPSEQNAEATIDMPVRDEVSSQLEQMGIDGHQNLENVQILSKLIYINMVFPIVRYFTMPGVYMWLTIMLLGMFIRKRIRTGYVLILPNVINLLVCLAAPLCNAMRYELPVVLSLPIILTGAVVLFAKDN